MEVALSTDDTPGKKNQSDTRCQTIFNICHVYIRASWSCVDSQADMNANEAERKESERRSCSEVSISNGKAA